MGRCVANPRNCDEYHPQETIMTYPSVFLVAVSYGASFMVQPLTIIFLMVLSANFTSLWKTTIEIVDVPTKHLVIFHSYVNVRG